jgi:hypothetical protein
MTQSEAYEHVAAVAAEWFPDQGWTADLVADVDRRLKADDSDVGDPLYHYVDFAMKVLERAGVVEAD